MPFIDGRNRCPLETRTAILEVLESTQATTTAVNNPDYETWIKQDKKLVSIFPSTLHPNLIHLIVDYTTLKEVWDSLKAALASPYQMTVLHLHLSLQKLDREKDNLSITAYLQKAKEIADELAGIGKPLSQSEINLFIFKGLRTKFDDLVTNLATQFEHVSFNELHALLLSHEFFHRDARPSVPK